MDFVFFAYGKQILQNDCVNVMQKISMDKIDEKILKALTRDSNLTSDALGEAVGLSGSAAYRRMKALEASGMITGYGARLSSAARGHPFTVFLQVTLVDQRRETMEAFEKAVNSTRSISEAFLMSGESDYLLKVLIPQADSYERVHRETLSTLPGVHRLVTQFTIRTLSCEAGQ